MYMYMYMYMYTYMRASVRDRVRIHLHMHALVHVHAHAYIYMYAQMPPYVDIGATDAANGRNNGDDDVVLRSDASSGSQMCGIVHGGPYTRGLTFIRQIPRAARMNGPLWS